MPREVRILMEQCKFVRSVCTLSRLCRAYAVVRRFFLLPVITGNRHSCAFIVIMKEKKILAETKSKVDFELSFVEFRIKKKEKRKRKKRYGERRKTHAY